MSPAERAACEAAFEALRAVLEADDGRAGKDGDALRIKDVTADYGVSPKTARRWAKRDGFKRGGVWFIHREAIEGRRP